MRLPALVAAALLCAGGVRAQGPKQSLFREVSSFRPAGEAVLGDKELLELALEEVVRQQTAAAPGAAEVEPEEPDVVAESRKTLARLTTAVNLKLRTQFMRGVHSDYQPDPYLLSESLIAQFRQFPTIRFTTDFERADVVDGDALVRFHFNLATTDIRGATNQYAGFTTVRFRMDGDRAKLVAQPVTPIIFGFGLGSTDNPQMVRQGPAPDRASTGPLTPAAAAPACPTPTSGTTEMEDTTEGMRFAAGIASGPTGASDFFRATMPPVQVFRSFTGKFDPIGACALSSVHQAPGNLSGFNHPFNVGDCFAEVTATGHYAIFRVATTGVNTSGNPSTTIQWKFQGSAPGIRCFP